VGITADGTAKCEPLPPPTALALAVEENAMVTAKGNMAIDPNTNESAAQLVANDGVGTFVLDPRRERTVVFGNPTAGQQTMALRAFEDMSILSVSCVANPAAPNQGVTLRVEQLTSPDANDPMNWTLVQSIDCSNVPFSVPVAPAATVPEGRWVRVVVAGPVPPPICQSDGAEGFVCANSTNNGALCGVGDPLTPDNSLCQSAAIQVTQVALSIEFAVDQSQAP
jgi:hypothetical protein